MTLDPNSSSESKALTRADIEKALRDLRERHDRYAQDRANRLKRFIESVPEEHRNSEEFGRCMLLFEMEPVHPLDAQEAIEALRQLIGAAQ